MQPDPERPLRERGQRPETLAKVQLSER